jgi:hypothetical protein
MALAGAQRLAAGEGARTMTRPIALSIRPMILFALAAAPALLAVATGLAEDIPTGDSPCCELLGKDLFIASPGPGVSARGTAFYVRAEGDDMMSLHGEQTRSDILNVQYTRLSSDNGQTWSERETRQTLIPVPEGVTRKGYHPGFVDPDRDVLLIMRNQLTAPSENPYGALRYWQLWYELSDDGGQTSYFDGQMIVDGAEYNSDHPFPTVDRTENCAMLGDVGCRPIKISTDQILVPFQINRKNAQSRGYFDSAVAIGTWNDQNNLDWRMSEMVVATQAQSPRGFLEPTIIETTGDRILMVMRAEGGHRWYSVSDDSGQTWSDATKWTFDDGSDFYSPSSMSRLFKHSSGEVFWIGNITDAVPNGNRPRYPLYIGRVDPQSLLLQRDSLLMIDDRQPGDRSDMTLSHVFVREDRPTGRIALYLAPFGREGDDFWTASTYTYWLEPTAIPEPGTIGLLIGGVATWLAVGRRPTEAR